MRKKLEEDKKKGEEKRSAKEGKRSEEKKNSDARTQSLRAGKEEGKKKISPQNRTWNEWTQCPVMC